MRSSSQPSRAVKSSSRTARAAGPKRLLPTSTRDTRPSNKPWGGRFREKTHVLVERFTSSLPFDWKLFEQDIRGSIAHCKTLERAKVLSQQECRTMIHGLERVRTEFRKECFPFAPEDEDIHMAVERRLTQLIGPLGGKLHTGRSRNDQVALDLRLYLRDVLGTLETGIQALQGSLLGHAKKHLDVTMPGYTHLQRAQPVLLAHHWLAYVEMLERDKGRLHDTLSRVDVMPLGSGALAGTNYCLDRFFTAKLLGFPHVTRNSIDAVSDRDFVVEVLASLSIIMMHLSRLSEELVLWSSQEFRFIELPDGFCTGSSMMPQKKNPDIPELVRGKTGRVYGHLLAVLTMLKGLPLSYNRDLQEDKEPLFDAIDTVLGSVEIYSELVKRLRVRRDVIAQAVGSGFLLATELADYLVMKGISFREAHGIVGRLVRTCLGKNQELHELTLSDLQEASPHFRSDALRLLTPEGAIARKAQFGGTARHQVETQLKAMEKAIHASAPRKALAASL